MAKCTYELDQDQGVYEGNHARPHLEERHETAPRRHRNRKKLAEFLVTHGRLVVRGGRPMLHFLGTCANHDGTHDYAVRTHVRASDGKHVTYDSTIRKYETGRLRLVR